MKSWWVSEEYAGVLSKMFANFDSLAYLQGTNCFRGGKCTYVTTLFRQPKPVKLVA